MKSLSSEFVQSQAIQGRLSRLLSILLDQCQSHSRQHSFTLGATRRSHRFEERETFLNTAKIAKLLGVTVRTVLRDVQKLQQAGLVVKRVFRNWSSIRFIADKFSRTFSRTFDPFGNVAAVDADSVGHSVGHDLSSTDSSDSGRCPTEGGYSFLSCSSKNTEHSNKQSASKGDSMFNKDQLPEEGKSKRKKNINTLSADELRKNPAYKGFHIDALIRLNNALAELPDGILGSRPRKNRISRKVFAKWKQVHGRGERSILLEYLIEDEDQATIVKQLRKAKMVHGSKWLTFEWVLSFPIQRNSFREDMANEPNLAKILDDRYSDVPDWLQEKRRQEASEKISKPAASIFDRDEYIRRVREEEATEKDNRS